MKIADDGLKSAFTQQAETLVSNYQSKNMAEQAIYTEASRLRNELLGYQPWSWSWAPSALGGYSSHSNLLGMIDPIIKALHPKFGSDAVTQRAIAAGPATPPQPQTSESATPPPGPSVAEGIASILNPLATAGAGIFKTQQESQLAKLAAKRTTTPQQIFVPAPPSNNSTTLILVAVGGIAALALIYYMTQKAD